jgi:hypothetical protein
MPKLLSTLRLLDRHTVMKSALAAWATEFPLCDRPNPSPGTAEATTLRELARRTSARFFRGEDDRQVEAAIEEILSSGRPVAGYQSYPIRRDLYFYFFFYFFAAAFVCMLAAAFL